MFQYGKDNTDSTLQVQRDDFKKALKQYKPAYTQLGVRLVVNALLGLLDVLFSLSHEKATRL